MRIVLNGTWKDDDASAGSRAINYWWGMASGVVELICSQNLPQGTKRLIDLLRNDICSETLIPFSGDLWAQDGTLMNKSDEIILPKDIITMDWLLDNVVGSIPAITDLTEEAQAVAKMQGVGKTQIPEA